jgi:N-acetyl-D-muramate 6-phosphate phosphatase
VTGPALVRPSGRALLEAAEAVLLDFDGPVCSVFAGYPAPDIARALQRLLAGVGARLRPGSFDARDPLAVLRAVHSVHPHLVAAVDGALADAETVAVRSARPTPGGAELLRDCRRAGRPVVVVTNNSAAAVRGYLRARGVSALVDRVVGRPECRPDLMKPHPAMVRTALEHLGVAPERAVLVGDSVTDVEVARRCGVPCIGYAARPGGRADLLRAGADQVIDCMSLLIRTVARADRLAPVPVRLTIGYG